MFDDSQLRAVLDGHHTTWQTRAGMRDAAVLAPLVVRGRVPCLLFIRRHDDVPHHAGQIAFPGGVRSGDETPLQCALRETWEEIGVADEVAVFGSLRELHSPVGFQVHPFVGRLPSRARLNLDPREVAGVVEVPLAALRDRTRWTTREVVPGRRSPCFPLADGLLWGLTARFTLDLVERLDRLAAPG